MKFRLSKYILPAVISMVLVGTYTNIDGLFIGNTAGDDGLAAINIAWPIVAFITSVGTGIGVGGSVVINDLRGKGNAREAERRKHTSLALLAAAGAIVTLLSLLVYKPLLKAMGAEERVFAYACNYAVVISAGAFLQIAGAGLTVLLRNDGKTVVSMLYTAIGLCVHIVLDFCTVKKYALYGVALSTVFSQGVVFVCCLITLKVKSEKAEEMMNAGLKIYALSYVLKAAVKFICAYCYSVRQKVTSDILTYLDPAVFTPLSLFVLSSVAGLNGVWWSVVCAQAAVCVAAAVIFAVRRKCKKV